MKLVACVSLGFVTMLLLITPSYGEEALTRDQLIKQLGLEKHIEGGYFRRTFQADHRAKIDQGLGPRYTMTSILYMLTSDSPVDHWHLNQSDIIQYYHLGGPITYYLIDAEGNLSVKVLGPDIANGQQVQVIVKGGTWKAAELKPGNDYGLLSEAVSPGFEYHDMRIGEQVELLKLFPQHAELIKRFSSQPDSANEGARQIPHNHL